MQAMNNAELIAKLKDLRESLRQLGALEVAPGLQTRLDVEECIRLASAPSPDSAEPVAWMNERTGACISHNERTRAMRIKTDTGSAAMSYVEEYTIPLYAHPPKPDPQQVELTDDEVSRVSVIDNVDPAQAAYLEHIGQQGTYLDGMVHGLRYARDNGYLAPRYVMVSETAHMSVEPTAPAKPFPVEEVMDCIAEQDRGDWRDDNPHTWSELRARLQAKFGNR